MPPTTQNRHERCTGVGLGEGARAGATSGSAASISDEGEHHPRLSLGQQRPTTCCPGIWVPSPGGARAHEGLPIVRLTDSDSSPVNLSAANEQSA